jgi:lipoprotein-anchoring transpeptidase ErfK/SrfK
MNRGCCGYLTGAMTRAMTIGLAAVAIVVVLFVAIVLVVDGTSDDTIPVGTRIATLDVGGLDRAAAKALVQRKLVLAVRKPVAAVYAHKRYKLRPEDAAVRLDVDATVDAAMRSGRGSNPFSRVLGGSAKGGQVTPKVTYSRAGVEKFVARTADRVDREARDADIDWHDGKLVRVRARPGVAVRRPQLLTAVTGVLGKPSGQRTVQVPVKVTERPDKTFGDFAKRYPTVLAVDRSAKVLRLYKNLKLVHKYRIAVGRAGLDTAAGRYKIREKIVNPSWHVPTSSWAGALAGKTIPPGDPQNPLEARWMGFYNGQGIHGTADLASLGTAASHGCIRMAVPDVKRLYAQVKIGTPLFLQ